MFHIKSQTLKRISRLIMSLIVAISYSISVPLSAMAIDETFYSGNDILFYKPDDICAPTTNSAISNNKIYVIGDSYTETDGLQAYGLKDKLVAQGYEVSGINASVGRSISWGGTTGDKSSGLEALTKDSTTIANSGTILVVLGTNGDISDKSVKDFMDKLHGLNPTARTFWVNINYTNTKGEAGNPSIEARNATLQKNASTLNYAVVNWHDASKGKDYWSSDGLHPNKTGYTSLVDLIVLNVQPAATATKPASNTNGKKIYVVGDSYTRELRARGFDNDLAAAGYQVVGYNASGGRSITQPGHDGDMSTGLSALSKDAALIASADIALVLLGTNGVAADKSPPNPDPYDMTKADIGKFMNALHKSHGNNNIQTFWVNLNFIGLDSKPFDVSNANKTLSENANPLNYSVIDWYAKTKNNTKSFLIDKHPNENGWSLLKTTILTALGPATSGSPSSVTTNNGSMVTSSNLEENARQLWQYLIGKGLTPVQAAGVMGNLQQESNFNPREHEFGSDTDDIPTYDKWGYGIVQWSFERKTVGLVKYLAEYQKTNPSAKGSDLQMQADYMWKELNTPNSRWNEALTDLKKATNVREAVRSILFKYEEPGDIYNEWDKRTTFANEILQKYSGLNGIDFDSGGKCSSSSSGSDGWDLTGNNAMVYYSQVDPKWADKQYDECTIGGGACGPTSLAMVLATLSDKNLTPVEIADEVAAIDNDGECGTAGESLIEIGKRHGLVTGSTGYDVGITDAMFDKAVSTIRAGGFVIMSVGPGIFTTTGHFIVMRKVSPDGQSFYLADPAQSDIQAEKNNKAYSRTTLVSTDPSTGGHLRALWYFQK